MNWTVLFVTKNFTENETGDAPVHKRGDQLVVKSNEQPGFIEFPKNNPVGVAYTAPSEYIHKRALAEKKSPVALSAEDIARYVHQYWTL